MCDTILVATDGSDAAQRAVSQAFDLASECNAALHVLFVVDTRAHSEPALSSGELAIAEVEDYGQEILADAASRGDTRGIDVVTRCCHGAPHEEILTYAEDVDADLTVLGYQGHGHAETDHVGSVTDRVLRSGGYPVLIA